MRCASFKTSPRLYRFGSLWCIIAGSLCAASLLQPQRAAAIGSQPEAEPTTGTRLPPSGIAPFVQSIPDAFDQPLTQSEREAYVTAEKLGACLVKADAAASMALVMAAPNSSESEAAQRRLKPHLVDCLFSSIDSNVVGIKMSLMPTTERGVIAEALYRLQFAGSPPPPAQSSAPPMASASAGAENEAEAIISGFAQCVTQANPAAVRSIIMSQVGSREEHAGVAALTPSLPSCLYKGQTLKVDRLVLRSRLAEALYPWSVAAAQHSTATRTR